MMFLAMMLVVLTAGVAVAADDVIIDNSNGFTGSQAVTANPNATATVTGVTATAGGGTGIGTGGTAIIDSSGNSRNDVKVNVDTAGGEGGKGGDASMKDSGNGTGTAVVNDRLQFPGTPGFNGYITPGVTVDGTQWDIFCPKIYRKLSFKNQVDEMAFGFHFSDLWFTNWGGRVQFTPMGPSLPKSEGDMMMCTNYWPLDDANDDDVVVGRGEVVGKENWSVEAFVAEAYKSCRIEKNSNRVAILVSQDKNQVTSSQSLNLSASIVNVAGSNTGVGGATGFGIGKSTTRLDKVDKIKYACLNDGHANIIKTYATYQPPASQPPPAPPVLQPEPAPQPSVCDQSIYLKLIADIDAKLFDCKPYSHNNLDLQLKAMKANISEWVCGGKREVKYLNDAIQHGYMAELNYIKGRDISKFGDSEKLISDVDYYLASAFFARDGSTAGYWKVPEKVRHVNKKTGKYEWRPVTKDEGNKMLNLRHNMENYSTDLVLN
ncbi:MAG TPA: hypothetical protein DEA43_03255 [Candidatus Moranbacteria bacterium]|nr:hypothetical protein [Candidatus Moranbacteria bacterium]